MDNKIKQTILNIQQDQAINMVIADLFCDFYDMVRKNNLIQGGCHFLSVLFHIILSEFGIENHLCLGNVQVNGRIFSHSWVEIVNKIYDIAISQTNDPNCSLSRVIFCNINTENRLLSNVEYGVLSESELVDKTGKIIAEQTIGDYILKCPFGKRYVLNLIIDFGKNHKKYLNGGRIMDKYKFEKWERK